MFDRRSLLFLCTTLVAAQSLAPAAENRPNIVLIVADDLGAHDLGCYGADLHETPNLDRLAENGVRFTQAYAPAPVCTPTRASILTGKHPARLRMTIWSEGALTPPTNKKLIPGESRAELPLEEVTLAERLHDAGYATAAIGKWHLGGQEHAPEQQGFDVAVGGTHWGAPQTFFWPYRGTGRFGDEFRYVPGLPLGKEGDYLTDKLTDAAIRFVDDAGDRPFFLYLAHYAPHTPIEAPAADVAHFTAKVKPTMRHQNPTYAAMVKNLDANVGRLLKHLEDRGLADNTMVVFTSDNGGYIGRDRKSVYDGPVTTNAPIRSGKGALYEGGIRVPLIVKPAADFAYSGIRELPVSLTDLFPTLLNVAGVSIPETFVDGIDLSVLITSSSIVRRPRSFFWHYPHYYETTTPVSAVRSGPFKLLEYYEDGHRELYDLANDPNEERDLAGDRPGQVEDLAKLLDEHRSEVNAALPTPNPNWKPKPAVEKTPGDK